MSWIYISFQHRLSHLDGVDRSSDVDLVVGIQPNQVQDFLAVIDTIIDVELGGLFPGWFDTLAPKLGGWGFVYLVPFKNILFELDLYIVPTPSIPSIIASGALEIHSNKNKTLNDEPDLIQNFEVSDIIKNDPALDLVIEALCLLHMMCKRTARQQWYIVYGLSYLINDAMRRFIKFCLIPDSPHWGWYHLEDELGVDPRGRKCLQALSTLININPTSDPAVIDKIFTNIMEVICVANPELSSNISLRIASFKYYTKLK